MARGLYRVFSDEERAERMKISQKKWRDKNRERIREYRAGYNAANRERVREYRKEYYRANAEHTNMSLFEIIPTSAKSKVYVDYEEYVPCAGVTETEVYGRNQQFKLVNQAKAKSTMVQIVMDDFDPMDHIVTYFADTASDTMRKLHIATFGYAIPQSIIDKHASDPPSTVVDIGSIKAWPLPIDIPESSSIKGSPPEETLSLIKHVNTGEHRLSADAVFLVMSWCCGRRVSFDSFIRWVEQGRELTPHRVERYADEWKRLDPAKRPSDNRIMMILALLFPDADIENKTLRGFKWYYDVPIDSHSHSLDELEITNKRKRDELEKTKFVYLACPMNSGKTQKMFERMTMLEEDKKSLFNVSRQTLALDIHSKCKSKGLVITNHMHGLQLQQRQ
eukprot:jgi/Tetstr1/433945/TSEL_023122.t1